MPSGVADPTATTPQQTPNACTAIEDKQALGLVPHRKGTAAPRRGNTVNPARHDPAWRVTTAAEKLFTSLINAVPACLLLLPWLWLGLARWQYQLLLVGLFLAENLLSLALADYRLPGMVLQGSRWQRDYPLRQRLLHALLYTASFASAVYWLWFPGDLLLLNLLLLQLPSVLLTGTTLHGWLSGHMVDVKPA